MILLLFFQNFLQYLFPQLIETQNSKFSGNISVYKFRNKYILKAGQVHQSGGWADALFKRVIFKFQISNFKLKQILILGLAGGTLVELFTKINPNVKITGVDIDPVMVNLGNKYFHVLKRENLKVIIDDAYLFVKKTENKFDLVFVDTFQGDSMPKKFTEKELLKNVIRMTDDKGYIIINRLYLPKFKKETDEYYQNLDSWQKEMNFKIKDYYQNIGNKVILLAKQGKI